MGELTRRFVLLGSLLLFAACGGGSHQGTSPGGAESCGSNTCGAGEFCCNRSCGTCAPEGGVCTQQFCG